MDIFQMLFNSLMDFPRAQFWGHSFLPYIEPLKELDSRNFNSSITELTNCLEAVQAWMGNSKLKLNPDKMEFIVIGDNQIRSSLKSSFPVSLLGNIMEPAELVKNLGVILDAKNSMQRHMANLCRISYYHLQEL